MSDVDKILEFIPSINCEIEKLRELKLIGSSLDCKVYGPFHELDKELILEILMVSQIEIDDEIRVEHAKGVKCERCWKILDEKCKRCE